MRLRGVSYKGLRRLLEDNDGRAIRADLLDRNRKMLTAMIAAEDVARLQGPPGWRIHQLTGDRAGTWSLSVSGNWCMTFVVEDGEIANLDLEDYH
jgi:toxin HigB-1